MRARCAFLHVFLGLIAQRLEGLLPKQGVVLDVDLRIEGDDVTVLRNDQRIDLDEARIAAVEQLHELAEDIGELGLLTAVEPEATGEPAALVSGQADRRMNGRREDLLGRFLGNGLDVHAPGSRGHDDDPFLAAVYEQAQVELAVYPRARLDVDDVDRQTLCATLMRHELCAE